MVVIEVGDIRLETSRVTRFQDCENCTSLMLTASSAEIAHRGGGRCHNVCVGVCVIYKQYSFYGAALLYIDDN